jgi:hypothetical protein
LYDSESSALLENLYDSESSALLENLKRIGWTSWAAVSLYTEDYVCWLSLDKFWIPVEEEYSAMRRKAIYILLQFSTLYLYEQAFSCLTSIKSKGRNRLISVEHEICVCYSKVRPKIKYLWDKEQAQVSH